MEASMVNKLMWVRVYDEASSDYWETLDGIVYSYYRNTKEMGIEEASKATDKFTMNLRKRILNGALMEEIDA